MTFFGFFNILYKTTKNSKKVIMKQRYINFEKEIVNMPSII